jgi:glutaconyl-CoA/methylmalonyl-CoA decarboxylase subunit delta
MNVLFLLLTHPADPGFTVAIVGFGIVLLSLTSLFILFFYLPKLINFRLHKRRNHNHKRPAEEGKSDFEVEGNVTAAISLAFHLYFSEQHDQESNIVTIKQVRKAYSPWSSKIYSVTRNWPNN